MSHTKPRVQFGSKVIWDAGGDDTVDASDMKDPITIDLREGHFSTIINQKYSNVNNIALAYNVTIENAIGGNGSDVIIGNNVDNHLSGGAGNDSITGGEGNDSIIGGEGNDSIDGGNGTDTAQFSLSAASYVISKNATGYLVSDKTKSEGVDNLKDIEHLHFPT